MLNLNSTVKLSKKQKDKIKSIGTLNKDSWDKKKTSLKGNISHQLDILQSSRCAYCDCRIIDGADVDHIAHKALYPQFTFEPRNLVLACTLCNEKLKGRLDTIDNLSKYYKSCKFKMVHPYFDDVDYYFDCSEPIIMVKKGLSNDERNKADWTKSKLQFLDTRFCEKRAREAFLNEYTHKQGISYEELIQDSLNIKMFY